MATRYGSFQELQSEVARLRESGDLAGALALMAREREAFPEQAAHAYLWRAGLSASLGRVDDAVRIFAEALAAGCRYPLPALQSQALARLHEIVEFERLAHIAAMRYDAELAASRPKLVIRRPARDDALGTLLVLHGNNSRADRTVPHWEPAIGLGWRLALAQSAEISWTPGMFVWDDRAMAERDVAAHVARLRGDDDVDPRRVVLAGYSMGALRALQLAIGGLVDARAVVVVGPYLPPAELDALVAPRDVRSWITVGERDREGHPGSVALADRLRAAGIPVHLDVRAGLGHAYPEDMEHILADALTFALG